MRKIERDMLKALQYGREFARDNTKVIFWEEEDDVLLDSNPYTVATVYLHGHPIAHLKNDLYIYPVRETFMRYPTRTTASRLRAMGIDCKPDGGSGTYYIDLEEVPLTHAVARLLEGENASSTTEGKT